MKKTATIFFAAFILFLGASSASAYAPPATDTITATAGANGSISPSGKVVVTQGNSQNFIITANEGAYIEDVVVDGSSVGPVESYNFPNVHANHTISATFLLNSYTITATSDNNGIITPSGNVSVSSGGNQSFIMTPNAGYHVANVLVNGSSIGAQTSYTFTNVVSNGTIAVSYAIDSLSIIATNGSHGTITPSGTLVLTYGSSQSYTIKADSGYHIGNVTIDTNTVVRGLTSKSFNAITRSHTIDAQFEIDTFTVYDSSANHGTVFPSGSNTVTFGSSFTATITPATGYHIVDVRVDGVSQGAISSVPFASIASSHTVGATFAGDTETVITSAGSNGTIYPLGTTKVAYGGSLHISIKPNAMFHVATLTDGESNLTPDTMYQLNNVTTNHTVSATFLPDTSTITASAGSHGTISPSGSIHVAGGSNQAFTITPDSNYAVDSLVVDGSYRGKLSSLQFNNVDSNHTIRATFIGIYDTIVSSSQGTGTISPSGTVLVLQHSNQSFSFTPDSVSSLTDVIVDGSSLGPQAGYTFPSVSGNHTIKAVFSVNTYTIVASAGANGSIAPVGNVSVTSGANKSFTITPNGGYHIASVYVDSVLQGAIASYTFPNVKAN